MIFKRIFETIALLVLIQLVANANGQCQQKDYDEADEAFQFITVFGHPKTSFPESDPDFQQLCKCVFFWDWETKVETWINRALFSTRKYQNDLTRLKTFARKCLNAFSKQTFGLLLRGVSREMKRLDFCSSLWHRVQPINRSIFPLRYCVKEREAFLVHNKCGGATITETKQCHSQLVKELKQIINAEQDSKIPFVCWWVLTWLLSLIIYQALCSYACNSLNSNTQFFLLQCDLQLSGLFI